MPLGGVHEAMGRGRGGDPGKNNWTKQLSYDDPSYQSPELGFNTKAALAGASLGPIGAGMFGAAAGSTPGYGNPGFTMGPNGEMTPIGANTNTNIAGDAGKGNNMFNTPINNQANLNPSNPSNPIFDPDRVGQSTPFGGVNFTMDGGVTTANQYLSPELQSLFSRQFTPGAYDSYGDDYMADATSRLQPVYDRQLETFQQQMANRGQPVGGELYTDTMGDVMDAQNRGWESAAFQAKNASENARMQDFNRLMAAMGKSTVDTQQNEVLGANQLLSMQDMNRANIKSQDKSNLWNTITNLGGAFMETDTFDDWWN